MQKHYLPATCFQTSLPTLPHYLRLFDFDGSWLPTALGDTKYS